MHDVEGQFYLLGPTHSRDAVETKAGASTASSAKIKVLNHKDYIRWKVGIGIMYSSNSKTCFSRAMARISGRSIQAVLVDFPLYGIKTLVQCSRKVTFISEHNLEFFLYIFY